jgi:hypothetical protein
MKVIEIASELGTGSQDCWSSRKSAGDFQNLG